MVRCTSARSKESLVQLHVVSPFATTPLDVKGLCNDIAERMQLLGGVAACAPAEGLPFVSVRCVGAEYNVVVRLPVESLHSMNVLRAACATLQECSADHLPVAVRVVKSVSS